MNLRAYKKDIEYFVGDFIEDCELFVALNPGRNDEEIAAIVGQAIDLYNDLKDKGNEYPKGEGVKGADVRMHFNALRNEMFAEIDSLCEKLSAVISAEK